MAQQPISDEHLQWSNPFLVAFRCNFQRQWSALKFNTLPHRDTPSFNTVAANMWRLLDPWVISVLGESCTNFTGLDGHSTCVLPTKRDAHFLNLMARKGQTLSMEAMSICWTVISKKSWNVKNVRWQCLKYKKLSDCLQDMHTLEAAGPHLTRKFTAVIRTHTNLKLWVWHKICLPRVFISKTVWWVTSIDVIQE